MQKSSWGLLSSFERHREEAENTEQINNVSRAVVQEC